MNIHSKLFFFARQFFSRCRNPRIRCSGEFFFLGNNRSSSCYFFRTENYRFNQLTFYLGKKIAVVRVPWRTLRFKWHRGPFDNFLNTALTESHVPKSMREKYRRKSTHFHIFWQEWLAFIIRIPLNMCHMILIQQRMYKTLRGWSFPNLYVYIPKGKISKKLMEGRKTFPYNQKCTYIHHSYVHQLVNYLSYIFQFCNWSLAFSTPML